MRAIMRITRIGCSIDRLTGQSSLNVWVKSNKPLVPQSALMFIPSSCDSNRKHPMEPDSDHYRPRLCCSTNLQSEPRKPGPRVPKIFVYVYQARKQLDFSPASGHYSSEFLNSHQVSLMVKIRNRLSHFFKCAHSQNLTMI